MQSNESKGTDRQQRQQQNPRYCPPWYSAPSGRFVSRSIHHDLYNGSHRRNYGLCGPSIFQCHPQGPAFATYVNNVCHAVCFTLPTTLQYMASRLCVPPLNDSLTHFVVYFFVAIKLLRFYAEFLLHACRTLVARGHVCCRMLGRQLLPEIRTRTCPRYQRDSSVQRSATNGRKFGLDSLPSTRG